MQSILSNSDDRMQIILGSLLGNGYICKGRKNDYLCMRHSKRHDLWLKTKSNELSIYSSKTPYYEYYTTITWRSICHPTFTELKKYCYQDGKKCVTMDWLDRLRDLAIAVWFGDSGTMTGRGSRNACLRTQSFGLNGNEIIEKYFNEVGFPCKINKSRKSYVIVFSIEGTKSLIDLIANSIPSPRLLKIMPIKAKGGNGLPNTGREYI